MKIASSFKTTRWETTRRRTHGVSILRRSRVRRTFVERTYADYVVQERGRKRRKVFFKRQRFLEVQRMAREKNKGHEEREEESEKALLLLVRFVIWARVIKRPREFIRIHARLPEPDSHREIFSSGSLIHFPPTACMCVCRFIFSPKPSPPTSDLRAEWKTRARPFYTAAGRVGTTHRRLYIRKNFSVAATRFWSAED